MLQVYRYLTYFLFPIFVILIYFRSFFSKEDKIRYKEKIFFSSFKARSDNKKKLVWFHAASIGECLSILPLIEKMNNNNKNLDFLITTVTLSSSQLLEKKLSTYPNIVHRFFPLDIDILAEKFLTFWGPDLICFVDSEIWPNFLFKIKEKNIPLLLVNARLTKKSFNKWKIISNFAKKVFNNFDLCLAASEESKNNLKKIQVENLKYIGNLKYSFQNTSEELENSNKKILLNFKTWCASSTHDEEELIVLKAHIEIKKKYNNILTIIIPRHIDRSSDIKNLTNKFNLNSQILNDGDLIDSNTEVLIINSFGVMSRYLNYCKNVFIGKSFVKKKENVSGQNPIEAAKLGCKIIHGPYVYNFQEIYKHLNLLGIAEIANNELELVEKIVKNFENKVIKVDHQVSLLDNYGQKILNETFLEINKYLK
jgi:3-deoxy-D-manno-octulosonic-acid transferase